MVGLVLVCHSAKLAEGVAELAAQVGGEGLRIAVAGGLDQPGSPLGTDAVRVGRAIEEVWSEDGVLVLMDLGSAVLSAEMALDLLSAERRDRVMLTEAPLVEGAVAAAVAAALGDSLDKVAEGACAALAAKAAHLAAPDEERSYEAGPAAAGFGRALRLSVGNRLGLHLRPAALLVQAAAGFQADVTVTNVTAGRGPASARSLNALATLGVRADDEVLVRAEGPEASEALAAIERLAAGNWGDAPEALDRRGRYPAAAGRSSSETAADGTPAPASGTVMRGLPASPGIAIGAARRLGGARLEIPERRSQDRAAERDALERALAATGDDIRQMRDAVLDRAGAAEAAIFDAHLLFLEDDALLVPAGDGISREGRSAARAWADAVSAASAAWAKLDDPSMRARAADLRSVGDQVLRRLSVAGAGGETEGTGGPVAASLAGAAVIVVAADLSPAEAAALDPACVCGVACAFGGPTSHGAILARSLGIPTVMGVGRSLLGVIDGVLLALDGEAGTIMVDPSAVELRSTEARRERRARDEAEARSRAGGPAITRDGVVVQVAANVTGPGDVPAAVALGADGVGLLRTELLFLQADHLPTEDEQERAYRAAAEQLQGRPLVLRTLDVGADKPLPYLPRDRERNPFLGVRGIRLGLRRPELLTGQLRAALRVAADHPVRVMFPMVTTVDEVREAKALLEEARESLVKAGVRVPARIAVGIMVEVPAAALTADAFAAHVDFFSIGTNDLAQYVLAAERGNAGVAELSDVLHPAVLSLIERTARAAAAAGQGVSVCGEVAGDPLAIPLLLGLGVTELSMAAPRIPMAKQTVRAAEARAARHLAAEALAAESAAAVRRLCGGYMETAERSDES